MSPERASTPLMDRTRSLEGFGGFGEFTPSPFDTSLESLRPMGITVEFLPTTAADALELTGPVRIETADDSATSPLAERGVPKLSVSEDGRLVEEPMSLSQMEARLSRLKQITRDIELMPARRAAMQEALAAEDLATYMDRFAYHAALHDIRNRQMAAEVMQPPLKLAETTDDLYGRRNKKKAKNGNGSSDEDEGDDTTYVPIAA